MPGSPNASRSAFTSGVTTPRSSAMSGSDRAQRAPHRLEELRARARAASGR